MMKLKNLDLQPMSYLEQILQTIKKLAEQMNALSLSNVSASMIDEVARAGVDEPVVGLL